MTAHTLSLSVLVLVCAAFPAQAFRLALVGGPAGSGPRRAAVPVALAAGLLAAAALVWYVAPASGVFAAPAQWRWCAVAVAAGCAGPVVEYGVGALVAVARGRRAGRPALHERAGAASASAVTCAVAIAVAEEVIFRGVGLHLLVRVLGWAAAPAVALVAVVYGLNHLYFGWLTVAQKIVTGVAYGVLYELGGHSVLVPALAHVVQNVVVLALLPRWTVRR